jgi:hypothetical protein
MRFSSSDQLLRRWHVMGEQLASPRAASGVLHSGLVYAKQCARCPCTAWVPKSIGKPPHRSYHPVCRRCGRDWPVDRADIRVGQVDCRRTGGMDSKYHDFASLTRIVHAPGLWERRVWIYRVFEFDAFSYAEMADELRRRHARKAATCRDGFFTARHCRTLVSRAREVVEARAVRAGIWDDVGVIEAAMGR